MPGGTSPCSHPAPPRVPCSRRRRGSSAAGRTRRCSRGPARTREPRESCRRRRGFGRRRVEHGADGEEFGRVLVTGPGEHRTGFAGLHDLAVAHDHDPVAECQRLRVVVGDVDAGQAELALQASQLTPQLHPDLVVEAAQRLIEQQHVRSGHDAAGQRHPLLLAAGEVGRLSSPGGRGAPGRALPRPARAVPSLGTLRIFSPKATLSSTLMLGNSARSGTPSRCSADALEPW